MFLQGCCDWGFSARDVDQVEAGGREVYQIVIWGRRIAEGGGRCRGDRQNIRDGCLGGGLGSVS